MPARRLLPLALGVTALLVLAGIASHGRPLSGSRGSGPTATFFDYVFTTIVLFAVVMLAVLAYSLASVRRGAGVPRRGRWHLFSSLIMLALSAAVAVLILHSKFEQRLRQLGEGLKKSGQAAAVKPKQATRARNARLRWDEVAIAAALLGGVAALLLASRRTRRPPTPWRLRSREAVSAALDFSLDDLRNEPDLRRAIIAAYARMERALAMAGVARRPSEAPFEYLERALRSLDTSGASVSRLTALFEWAKFSQHEPGPEMRDEAIVALASVRDELRRPHEAAAA
ncbi:MAG TPA: DUF4129 domain-containing protein [Gaiellaceae bacterium]|nr:DUF4129 domain-containing protein [Gaiellaceae bacterium]